MKLLCGKCKTVQEMQKKYYGKMEYEFAWYCPKCDDLISQSAVSTGEKK